MTNDKVSIILPVYNSENTIFDTINSILNQNYKNFELIIINDGSTDSTENVCISFSDKRINYTKIKNSGVSYARNYALSIATGKYIMFIDSDDYYESTYVSKMVNAMRNKVELVCCGYMNFEKNNKQFIPENRKFDSKIDYIEYLQSLYLFNQIWNKIYLLDIINSHNLKFDNNLSIAEDWNFNIDYLNCVTKFSTLSECLYNYRISNSGLGFKYRSDASDVKLRIIDKMNELFFDEKSFFISDSYVKQYYSYFSNIIDSRNTIKFSLKIKKIKLIIKSDGFLRRINNVRNLSSKNKILFFFLRKRNIVIIIILSMLANVYDRLIKKIKFGI